MFMSYEAGIGLAMTKTLYFGNLITIYHNNFLLYQTQSNIIL